MSFCVFKYLQWMMVVACILLQEDNFVTQPGHITVLTSGALVGYVIILTGLIICDLMCNPVALTLDIWWSVIGATIFLVAGCYQVLFWTHLDFSDPDMIISDSIDVKRSTSFMAITCGGIMVACGILMVLDAITGYCLTEEAIC